MVEDPAIHLLEAIKQVPEFTKANPGQEEMARAMFDVLRQENMIVVAQGPTGMGKSLVVAAVTKALIMEGRKVCVALPTYNHLHTVMGKAMEQCGLEFAELAGIESDRYTDMRCPIDGESPNYLKCKDRTSKCQEYESDCMILSDEKSARKAPLVLTVHHKLVYDSSLIERFQFEVLIFDESHGLESVIRSRYYKVLDQLMIQNILTFFEQYAPDSTVKVKRLQKKLQLFFSKPRERVPPSLIKKNIIPVLESFSKIVQEQEKEEHTLDLERSLRFDAQHLLYNLKEPDYYDVLPHSDKIYAIPKKLIFGMPTRIPERVSVGLVSATWEIAKEHVNDTGFSSKKMVAPVIINDPFYSERFKRRPIFGLVDGPILKKDPSDFDAYIKARNTANTILLELLPRFQEPILVLCRSNDDQARVFNTLAADPDVRRRLFRVDEDPERTLDAIQDEINTEIRKGRNIIMATTSSRLWEGINLQRLKLVVIDALPYPSPQPSTQRRRIWRRSTMFRYMIRRLQQGLGRLVRSDGEWGIGVVIDNRFYAQWKTISKDLPLHIIDPGITRFINANKIGDYVLRAAGYLRADPQHKYEPTQRRLTDFSSKPTL